MKRKHAHESRVLTGSGGIILTLAGGKASPVVSDHPAAEAAWPLGFACRGKGCRTALTFLFALDVGPGAISPTHRIRNHRQRSVCCNLPADFGGLGGFWFQACKLNSLVWGCGFKAGGGRSFVSGALHVADVKATGSDQSLRLKRKNDVYVMPGAYSSRSRMGGHSK